MKTNFLLFLSIFLTFTSAFSQYCIDAGPTSPEDSNLNHFRLIGEFSEIIYEGCAGIIGVEDQTDQVSELIPLNSYIFEVEWGTCDIIEECSGAAWIDFNSNEEFEPSELIFSQALYGGEHLAVDYDISIPDVLPGDYRLRIMQIAAAELPLDPCETFEKGSITDFTIRIIDPPSCPAPNRLIIEELSYNSAEISWSEGGDETDWYFDWGISGFIAGESDPSPTIFSYVEFIGLEPQTSYDFYVKAICAIGDSSTWRGPFTFVTKCRPYESPFFCEDFEDSSPTLSCWTVLNENGDGDEFEINLTESPRSGELSAGIDTDLNGGLNDDWLISPPIELTGNDALTFWLRVNNSFEPNDLEVLISTTGTDIVDFTDTVLDRAVYSNAAYQQFVVNLTDHEGTAYVAFHIPNPGLDGSQLYIDDICVGRCMPTPSINDTIDLCVTEDYIDLRTVIDVMDPYGVWKYRWDASRIVSDHFFDLNDITPGEYEVYYISEGLCDIDTTIALIRVLPELVYIEGELNVCKKEPVNLFSGIPDVRIVDGAWTYDDGSPVPSHLFIADTIVGATTYFYTYTNGACPEITIKVTVTIEECEYVSIKENKDNELQVYPNPANSFLNINLENSSQPIEIEILNFSGKIVRREVKLHHDQNPIKLNLQTINSGRYMLRIISEDAVYITSVIILKD